jgi:hypothetical protein
MRRRRLRAWTKWGAAVTALLLTAAAVVSGWCTMTYRASHAAVRLRAASIQLYYLEGSREPPGGLSFDRPEALGTTEPRWDLWFYNRNLRNASTFVEGRWIVLGNGTSVGIPMWLPVGLLGLVAGLLWAQDRRVGRRRREGRCQMCGYDLRGLVSSGCPECGAPPTK